MSTNPSVKHFHVPTDRVLSYDEFKNLVQSQMKSQPAAAPTPAEPAETPAEVAHREYQRGLQLLRDGLADQQRAGLHAPPPPPPDAAPLLPGGEIGANNNNNVDIEGLVRFFPQQLQFVPRFVHRAVTTLFNMGAAVLPYAGALLMILMMVGFDDADGRLWRILAFFAVLKFARVIAERVRLNVVVPPQEQPPVDNGGENEPAAGHEQPHDPNAPPAPAAPPGPRFTPRELLKRRLIKCATVFIVSLSPSFRLERLLRELHEEGIAFD